jgi:hypothetical protein
MKSRKKRNYFFFKLNPLAQHSLPRRKIVFIAVPGRVQIPGDGGGSGERRTTSEREVVVRKSIKACSPVCDNREPLVSMSAVNGSSPPAGDFVRVSV